MELTVELKHDSGHGLVPVTLWWFSRPYLRDLAVKQRADNLRFSVVKPSACGEARQDLYGHGLSNAPPVVAWLMMPDC